ncbi:hypothetical protein [Noviherbaspirillum aerium]|uniref:hypothetical protein n=1 Tax=Noviherbaspirillum aerium TaxID=2588497 RepID=UPI001CEF940D|nr:hypothetical protein [Noviherbaspirillum aerium]
MYAVLSRYPIEAITFAGIGQGDMELQVESAPGPHGDIEPRAFMLGARRIEVIEIVDRWLALEYSYFKIAASDGATYILRYTGASSDWQMTLFKSSNLP